MVRIWDFRPWGVCFHLIYLLSAHSLVSWHHVDAMCTRKNGPRLWLEYRWNILGNRIIRVNWIISPNSSPYTGREYLPTSWLWVCPYEPACLKECGHMGIYTVLNLGLLRTSVSPLALSRFCQIPKAFSLSRAKPPSSKPEVTHLEQSFPREVRLDLQLEAKPPRHNKLNQPSSVIDPWEQVIAVLSHWVWGVFLHSIV